MVGWLVALVLGVATLLEVGVVRADGYQDALARGVEARDRALETDLSSDWQVALDEFSRALDVRPNKEVRFEWAEAAARLRFEDEAFEAYQLALEEGLGGRAGERARLFVETREPELSWLDIKGPAGATVFVRSRERGTLPFEKPLAVVSGNAQLEVRSKREADAPYRQVVAMRRGETVSVEVRFAKASASPEPEELPVLPQASERDPDQVEQAPPPIIIPPPKRARWATNVLIGAAGLVAAGAATYVVAGELLRDENRKLGRYCAEFQGDRCTYATPENRARAERAANRIEALEWTRLIGAGGVAIGLVGGAVVFIVTRPTVDEQPKVGFEFGPTGFSASYAGSF